MDSQEISKEKSRECWNGMGGRANEGKQPRI